MKIVKSFMLISLFPMLMFGPVLAQISHGVGTSGGGPDRSLVVCENLQLSYSFNGQIYSFVGDSKLVLGVKSSVPSRVQFISPTSHFGPTLRVLVVKRGSNRYGVYVKYLGQNADPGYCSYIDWDLIRRLAQ
jgi:hypothetical protein